MANVPLCVCVVASSYLLLNLLLLDKLGVCILQLAVQAGVFVWTRLPDGSLSSTITEQSLEVRINTQPQY